MYKIQHFIYRGDLNLYEQHKCPETERGTLHVQGGGQGREVAGKLTLEGLGVVMMTSQKI